MGNFPNSGTQGSKGREPGGPLQASAVEHHVHHRTHRRQCLRRKRCSPPSREDFPGPATGPPGTARTGFGGNPLAGEPHTQIKAILRTVRKASLGSGSSGRCGRRGQRGGPRVTPSRRASPSPRTRGSRLTRRLRDDLLLGGRLGTWLAVPGHAGWQFADAPKQELAAQKSKGEEGKKSRSGTGEGKSKGQRRRRGSNLR